MASATGMQTQFALTDEGRFFAFTKQYFMYVATIASIPIISTLLDVLPPPQIGGGKSLSLLASLACLITFGGTFHLRGLVASYYFPTNRISLNTSKPQTGWWMLNPPLLLAFLFLIMGIIFTSTYLSIDQRTIFWKTCTYFFVYPPYVAALGLILVIGFTQQVTLNIQSHIQAHAEHLSPAIFNLLTHFFRYRHLAPQDSLMRKMGNQILKPYTKHLENLSRGAVEVPGLQALQIHNLLVQNYNKRIDAVSDRDLNFWADIDRESIARDYWKLNLDAVQKGIVATRLFIITDEDLQNPEGRARFAKILHRQNSAGIHTAVTVYEALDSSLTVHRSGSLDFALFDFTEAISYFRDYRETARQFRLDFNVTVNQPVFEEQVRIYVELIGSIFVCSESYMRHSADFLVQCSKHYAVHSKLQSNDVASDPYRLVKLIRSRYSAVGGLVSLKESFPFIYRGAQSSQDYLTMLENLNNIRLSQRTGV